MDGSAEAELTPLIKASKLNPRWRWLTRLWSSALETVL